MKEIVLRDLFEDLYDFRRDFNQMFNKLVTPQGWQEQAVFPMAINFMPKIETYVDKEAKKYFCRVYLPGIDPKEVQINAQGNLLTINGERKFTETKKNVDYLEKEVAYGKFERMLTLPEGVQIDKLAAEYVNGVLEITAPVAMAALPRKIEISTPLAAKKIAA